jgi:SHS2 domain-containing protein
MSQKHAGFREHAHTADLELEVWASDLSQLLVQAARGLYALSGVCLQPAPRLSRTVDLQAPDPESLLVKFLSELLFLIEDERLAFDTFDLKLEHYHLLAGLEGAPLASIKKEIKAVTYHQLIIKPTQRGLTVRIVFDV